MIGHRSRQPNQNGGEIIKKLTTSVANAKSGLQQIVSKLLHKIISPQILRDSLSLATIWPGEFN